MKSSKYSPITILFHWVTAFAVFGLFALGLWMVELSYYDSWYQAAPDIHRSIGILLAILMLFRLVWRNMSSQPEPLANHKPLEKLSAKVTHWLLYVLVLLICVSGYLISTAKGQAIEVFNWFSVPALVTTIDNLEDTSGLIHELCAFTLIALTVIHAAASIKHHFIDRDRTLIRMFGK